MLFSVGHSIVWFLLVTMLMAASEKKTASTYNKYNCLCGVTSSSVTTSHCKTKLVDGPRIQYRTNDFDIFVNETCTQLKCCRYVLYLIKWKCFTRILSCDLRYTELYQMTTVAKCKLNIDVNGITVQCFIKKGWTLSTKDNPVCGVLCQLFDCAKDGNSDSCKQKIFLDLNKTNTVISTPSSTTSLASTSTVTTPVSIIPTSTSTSTSLTTRSRRSSTSSTPTTAASPVSSSEKLFTGNKSELGSDDQSNYGIVGGAVGGVVGVAVIVISILVVVWVIRRRRSAGSKHDTVENAVNFHKEDNAVDNPTYNTNTDDDVEKPTYEYIDIEGNGNYEEPTRVKSFPLGKDVDVSTDNGHDLGATSVYSVLSKENNYINYQHDNLVLQPQLPLDNTYNTLEEDNNVAVSHNIYNRINRSDLETPTDCTDDYDHALPNARNDVNATSDEYHTLKVNDQPHTLSSEYFTLDGDVQNVMTDDDPSEYFTLETSGEGDVQDVPVNISP